MPEETGWLAEAIKTLRADAGAKQSEILSGYRGYAVIPDGYRIESLAAHYREELEPHPMRAKGTLKFTDPKSFAAYYNAHKRPESIILADRDTPGIVGVLNGHKPNGEAGWCDHRAILILELSREFKLWSEKNGKAMPQTDFAQFIEDNLPDIAEPAPAEILEIVRTIEGTSNSTFSGAVRQRDGGHKLSFETTVEARAGVKGELKIPDSFTVSIPIFRDGPSVRIVARLRFRIANGNCSMHYDLYRMQDAKDQAFAETCRQIEHDLECGEVLFGKM